MSKCKKTPFDFTVFQGDDYAFSAFYKDPDSVAIDVTGYSARMQARAEYDSDEVSLDLTVGAGITITVALGKFRVEIPNEATAAMVPGVYVYDLEITTPDGYKRKLVFGKITILAEVTKQ